MGNKLFEPIVEESKLNRHFVAVRDSPPGHPGRSMMEEIYAEFVDPDGHFLQQFQTNGFDARLFELYLFAMLSRERYGLDRSHESPDFIAERNGVRVAIEATTVNPSTSGALAGSGKSIDKLTGDEIREYEQHELAIRFGGPLLSKLRKRYWDLPHCKDLPLVIVIQAFHDKHAHVFSDNALSQYLYGLGQNADWTGSGELAITTTPIHKHAIEGKVIPSNFFGQQDAEHISAVVFSNSGSLAKFDRIGFQHGYGNETFNLTRAGTSFNPDPDAMDPTLFFYDVGQPPQVEHWSQGLVVCHNPNAMFPLPRDFFDGAVQAYVEDGVHKSDHPHWHPISSKTFLVHLHELKSQIPQPLLTRPAVAVMAIGKRAFQSIVGVCHDENPLLDEHGWFSDMSESFLGVVIFDRSDEDWGFVILARDPYGAFRAIKVETSLPSRIEARERLQICMSELILQPKRIFVQD